MIRLVLFLLGLVVGAAAVYLLIESAPDKLGAEHDIDDDDDISIRQRVFIEDGRRLLRLTPDERELAGIRSAEVETGVRIPEFPAIAMVVDPAPLLELRDAVIAAQTARDAQRGTMQRLEARVQRLRDLARRGEIVATAELSGLEIDLQREAERAADHASRLTALQRDATLTWGAELGTQVTQPETVLLEEFGQRRQVLLRLTLRPADTLPPDTAFVFVHRSADRSAAAKAYLIDAAPATSPTIQGETYFLRTQLRGLRAGMRLNVWVPDSRGPIGGVTLPYSAVVWHGGRRWLYLEVDTNAFERRALPAAVDDNGGLFIPDGLDGDRPVVIEGAQALLAEEFRGSIPEEDED
jgi:hypothetical protein